MTSVVEEIPANKNQFFTIQKAINNRLAPILTADEILNANQ